MTDPRQEYPWLAGFSDEQVQAAVHSRGHALVSAAPGSGKTKMVIGYCGVLLARGVKPDEVLGLAFNVDAAKEVNARLSALPLPAAKRLKFRTIHSFCKEVLEVAQEEGLLPARELITSEVDAANLARQALAGDNGNPYDVDELKVGTLRQGLTMAKASMVRLDQIDDHKALMTFAENDEEVAKAMLVHDRMRREGALRTFDDLIYDLACLFQDSEEARNWSGNEFAHIIVDEYQDVDDAQQLVVLTLLGTRGQLMVVGDEDQCIYGWRGANLRYMMQGLEDYLGKQNVTRYQLSQTFRYGHELAVAANSLIRNNVERPIKLCVSNEGTPRTTVSVRMASTRNGDRYWPQAVVQDLREWSGQGRKMRECAVLVRTYELAAPLEMHLIRERIPYIIEGRGILGMPEVKAINAYAIMSDGEMFEACGDEGKQQMLAAVLGSPGMFLPRKFIERLSGSLANASLSDVPGALRQISEADGLRPFQVSSLRKRAGLIEKLGKLDNSMSDIATIIWNDLDWRGDVQRRIADPLKQSDRLNVINLMVREVSRYENVEAMLDAFSERMEQQDTPELMRDPLLITSIHKSKGQEFPMVFIPGLVEGQFPHQLPDQPVDMEAERRLAFVGITRGKEHVRLFAPNDLELANRWKIPVNPLESRTGDEARAVTSRFLHEIEPEAIRAARTWFYGDGNHPMVDSILDYAAKVGRPVPGAHTLTKGLLTDQPLATEVPEVELVDYDFQF
jgi:DNA helicase II / ATP-dependent DNA helicase PcrA